jgi:hypothetical protein
MQTLSTTIGVDLPKAGSEVLSPTSTTFSFRRLAALLPGEFDGEIFSCIVMMSNEALQRGQVGPFDASSAHLKIHRKQKR